MSKDMSLDDFVPVEADGAIYDHLHGASIRLSSGTIEIKWETGALLTFELSDTFDDEGRKLQWVSRS